MKSNDVLDGFVNSVVHGSLISTSLSDQEESEVNSEEEFYQEETEEISEEESDQEEIEEISDQESDQEETEEIFEEESAAESGEENETESEVVAYSSLDYSDRFTNIENSQYVLCAELLAIILLFGILTGLKKL